MPNFSKDEFSLLIERLEGLEAGLSSALKDYSANGITTAETRLEKTLKDAADLIPQYTFSILRNLSYTFIDTYRQTPAPGRQNATTMIMNSAIASRGNQYFYSVFKKFTYDTPDNRLLVASIYSIQDQLHKIIKESRDKLDTIRYQGNIGIEKIFNSIFDSAQKILEECSTLLNSELADIEPSSFDQNEYLFREDYRFFVDLESALMSPQSDDGYKLSIDTESSVFERYGLYLMDQALKSKGYRPTSKIDYLKVINQNETLIYSSEKGYAVLKYNSSFNDYSVTTGDNLSHVWGNLAYIDSYRRAQHNRPDFALLLFDQKKRFLSSVILEVKDKPYDYFFDSENNLKDDSEIDDIGITLEDYIKFGYVSPEERLLPGAVERLIIMCCDPNERKNDQMKGAVSFVGVAPRRDRTDAIQDEITRTMDEIDERFSSS